ncbi:MAG: type I restriction enzyme HsdR N-terminal domain-containing protein [Bacteroidia bacterium]
MQKLNFPTYQFKVKKEGEKLLIYDKLRKGYFSLTPEEWVRQHAVEFLTQDKHLPESWLQIEKQLNISGRNVRFDLVCQNNFAEILLLLECKAPNVKLTQATFDQILRYNNVLKSKYLWITNGLEHFIFEFNETNNKYENISIQNFLSDFSN